jgi:cell division protein YceG involved in septum cleavage
MRKVSLSLLFVIIVICFLAFTECGSKKKETVLSAQYPVDKSDTVVVDLQEITDTTVVIYETEQADIVLGYSHFMENLQAFIDQYNVSDDITLSEKVRKMASATDSINIAELEAESRLIERFHYRLADMLEKGAAAVYSKGSGTPVESILVEHFEFSANKMAGRGGRRFYLPDRTLFLEVLDWIS